jgi:hypothetical protein
MPQNLKKLYAPPSGLQPTMTLKSDAMAALRAELGTDKAFQEECLRLSGAVVCRMGAEHQRKGNACEDVPFCGETGRYQVPPPPPEIALSLLVSSQAIWSWWGLQEYKAYLMTNVLL